jgi:hypothetical protein
MQTDGSAVKFLQKTTILQTIRPRPGVAPSSIHRRFYKHANPLGWESDSIDAFSQPKHIELRLFWMINFSQKHLYPNWIT